MIRHKSQLSPSARVSPYCLLYELSAPMPYYSRTSWVSRYSYFRRDAFAAEAGSEFGLVFVEVVPDAGEVAPLEGNEGGECGHWGSGLCRAERPKSSQLPERGLEGLAPSIGRASRRTGVPPSCRVG